MLKRKWIDLAYDVGTMVYLKTDRDQGKRIITSISIRQSGVLYELSCGTQTSWHYDFEMTEEIDVVSKVTQE